MPPAPNEPATYRIAQYEFQLLLGCDQILARVEALAQLLNARYRAHAGEAPVLLPILKGSLMFLGDLMPRLDFAYELAPLRIVTYGSGMQSAGSPEQLPVPDIAPAGRDFVVVEDIVDSGNTLSALSAHLAALGVGSVFVATLLFKPHAFRGTHRPDWVGFEIADAFVVGYGMDYAERGRHLRGVYQLVS